MIAFYHKYFSPLKWFALLGENIALNYQILLISTNSAHNARGANCCTLSNIRYDRPFWMIHHAGGANCCTDIKNEVAFFEIFLTGMVTSKTANFQKGRIVVWIAVTSRSLLFVQQFAPPARTSWRGELLYEEQSLVEAYSSYNNSPLLHEGMYRRGELLYDEHCQANVPWNIILRQGANKLGKAS